MLTSQEVAQEFYAAGGKSSHLLFVLDTSQSKTKANEVGVFSFSL